MDTLVDIPIRKRMKIKEKFDAPFGPVPELRLTTVPRWPIIKMGIEQSVAEHCFGVAIITGWLGAMMKYDPDVITHLMVVALHHDDNEVYTGDIPSPVKDKPSSEANLVKLADLIETYRFATAHCIDTDKVKYWLKGKLRQKIYNTIREMGIAYTDISPLLEE